MKTVRPKKRGRPATGRDPLVQVRLPKSLLSRIDRWAGRFDDMDRSTALRCLLGLGLGRSSRSKAPKVYDPKTLKAHHAKRKDVAPKATRPQPSKPDQGRGRLVLIKGAVS